MIDLAASRSPSGRDARQRDSVAEVAFPIGEEGDTCQDDEGVFTLTCDDGLVCGFESKTCDPLPEEGEECAQGRCAGDLRCVNEFDENMVLVGATCQPAKTAGEECFGWNDCETFECIDGVCAPPIEPGEMCQVTCIEGYICLDQTCQKAPEPGEPCIGENERCAVDGYCDDGTCKAFLSEGETCIDQNDDRLRCQDDLICANRRCDAGSIEPGCGCGDNFCFTARCQPYPPWVCADNGFLF